MSGPLTAAEPLESGEERERRVVDDEPAENTVVTLNKSTQVEVDDNQNETNIKNDSPKPGKIIYQYEASKTNIYRIILMIENKEIVVKNNEDKQPEDKYSGRVL